MICAFKEYKVILVFLNMKDLIIEHSMNAKEAKEFKTQTHSL